MNKLTFHYIYRSHIQKGLSALFEGAANLFFDHSSWTSPIYVRENICCVSTFALNFI